MKTKIKYFIDFVKNRFNRIKFLEQIRSEYLEIIKEIDKLEKEKKKLKELLKEVKTLKEIKKERDILKKENYLVIAINDENEVSISLVPINEAKNYGISTADKIRIDVRKIIPNGTYTGAVVIKNIVSFNNEEDKKISVIERILGERPYFPINLARLFRRHLELLYISKEIILSAYTIGKGEKQLKIINTKYGISWQDIAKYGVIIVIVILILIFLYALSQKAVIKPPTFIIK